MLSVGLLLLSIWASSTLAQDNDWSKPCLNGVCFYDLPPSADGAGAVGTLKIWGSSDAITDVTRAAGWEILDCNKDALTQRIRLVCTGDAKCDHLFKGRRGPRGKVVRLPESCGKNAFAHIKAARPSPDQRIPASVASRIIRRDGIEPEVEELEIDTDFATGATEIQEPVYFSLVGSNTQAVAEEDVTKDLGDLEPRWKADKSHTFPLFSYHKPFVLVDQSLTCPAGSASLNGNLKISGTLDADVTVTVGVYAKGSIFPPNIDQFKAYAVLNGAVSGAIDLAASLSGSYSTGRMTLVEAAITGINFAGILTIGPTIGVAASVDASFGLAANVRAGFNWQLVQAQLYLPASSSPNGQAFQIGTAPLELTITPTASATASIEAHIIPIVALKLKALGIVEAQVYVDLDASARAVADVSVSATGIITIPSEFPSLAIREPLATGISSSAPETAFPIRGGNPIGGLDTSVAIEQRAEAEAETEAQRAAWSYTYGGCLDVDAGIDINLGANAKFFGFFEKGKVFDIYTKNWDLYYGCFGDRKSTAAARRDNWARSINGSSMGALEKRLTCSTNNNNAAPVTVISTTTSGSAAVPK